MLKDLEYAVKVIRSVRSGYVGLAWKAYPGDEDPWERIDDQYEEYMLPDPVWVCAEFRNGRHIPLPLITGTSDCGPLQSFALRLMFDRTAILHSAYCALYECAMYEGRWGSDRLEPEVFAALRAGNFKAAAAARQNRGRG